MPFEFERTDIADVVVATPQIFSDERGYLLESYDRTVFEEVGIDDDFQLAFYSRSRSNVLRGLHMQVEPAEQAKLVHVSQGSVFDVVVDLRGSSDTFGEHVVRTLSGDNKEILYVPEGFAHGYLVQEDDTVVHYKASAPYSPENVEGLAWDSQTLDVDWPTDGEPILSDQDQEWPTLREWRARRT
ncbi:dTDP-4-dehydrorhamnose 3,5-epimerase [Haloplanus pelagicus]|uniref:dTDP-4-dehydrorhamnose 3,5-epimerase n=1 Tax=Haloplanus pelagicus TaxID=2949995 RepID=UPI00203F11C2|nr:dTDP-4-dehydrorhamnose 3,5-epimerase [Haloplanus sp. HW8-1]